MIRKKNLLSLEEITKRNSPWMWNKGYVFQTNVERTNDQEKIKQYKIISSNTILWGERGACQIIRRVIAKGLASTDCNGKLISNLWPVFAEVKFLYITMEEYRNTTKH